MLRKYVYFVCPRCGRMKILYETFDNKCPCGEQIRKYTITYDKTPLEEKGGVNAMMKENIRHSYAMGISPHQLPEAMRLWPDSKYVPDKTGKVLLLEVRNLHHKLKCAKERGMVEVSSSLEGYNE